MAYTRPPRAAGVHAESRRPRTGWRWAAARTGSLDTSLCPEVAARGAIFDILPATDPYLASELLTGWERLTFAGGMQNLQPQRHGEWRHAGLRALRPVRLSRGRCAFPRDLLERVQQFASATGNVWEYHDIHDPAWGGEKRRLWDSAVLLLGMTHALFDIQRQGDQFYFLEKPAPVESSLPPMTRAGL